MSLIDQFPHVIKKRVKGPIKRQRAVSKPIGWVVHTVVEKMDNLGAEKYARGGIFDEYKRIYSVGR